MATSLIEKACLRCDKWADYCNCNYEDKCWVSHAIYLKYNKSAKTPDERINNYEKSRIIATQQFNVNNLQRLGTEGVTFAIKESNQSMPNQDIFAAYEVFAYVQETGQVIVPHTMRTAKNDRILERELVREIELPDGVEIGDVKIVTRHIG